MVLDSLSSPHRRSQAQLFSPSPSFRKALHSRDELGSWSAIYQRHRFLLMTMALLAFLCTIYLYFAVTLGATKSELCSGLTGNEAALCRLRQMKDSMPRNGKLKLFLGEN